MRLRVRFQKLGKVRWTSHRDVARMWERACRRVRLPLAWTGLPRDKETSDLRLGDRNPAVIVQVGFRLPMGRHDGGVLNRGDRRKIVASGGAQMQWIA